MCKKNLLLIVCLFLAIVCHAQQFKKIKVDKPGSLTTILPDNEKSLVTKLKISGTLDARDYLTMRNLAKLEQLDLSASIIIAYKGKGGTFEGSFNSDSDTSQYVVDEIPAFSFIKNTSLKSIILPKKLKSIGDAAFLNCENLSEVVCPQMLEAIHFMAFQGCSSITEFELGEKINFIDRQAFTRCVGLKSITFNSDSINGIGDNTFYACKSLNKIIVNTSSPTVFSLSKGVFDGLMTNKNKISLYVRAGTKAKYQKDINWKDFPNVIEF